MMKTQRVIVFAIFAVAVLSLSFAEHAAARFSGGRSGGAFYRAPQPPRGITYRPPRPSRGVADRPSRSRGVADRPHHPPRGAAEGSSASSGSRNNAGASHRDAQPNATPQIPAGTTKDGPSPYQPARGQAATNGTLWKWVQGGKTKDGPVGIAAPSGVVAGTGNAGAPNKVPGGYGGVAAPAPSAPAGVVAGTGNAGGSSGKQPNPYGGTTSDGVPPSAPPKIGTLNPGSTTDGGTPVAGTPNRPIPPVVIVAPPGNPSPPVSYLPPPQPGGTGAGTAPVAHSTAYSPTAIATPSGSPRNSVNRTAQPPICTASQNQRTLDLQGIIANVTLGDVGCPTSMKVSPEQCAGIYKDNEGDKFDPYLEAMLASTSAAGLAAAEAKAKAYVDHEFSTSTQNSLGIRPPDDLLKKIKQVLDQIIGQIATCVSQKVGDPAPPAAAACTFSGGQITCPRTLLPVSQQCRNDPASCVGDKNGTLIQGGPTGLQEVGGVGVPGNPDGVLIPVVVSPNGVVTPVSVGPNGVVTPLGGEVDTPGSPSGGTGTTPGSGTATTSPVAGTPTTPPAAGNGTTPGTSPGSGTTPNPTVIPKPTAPPAVVNAPPGGAAPGSGGGGGGGGSPVVIAAAPNPSAAGSSGGSTAVSSGAAAGAGSGTASGSSAPATSASNASGSSPSAAAGSNAAGSTPGTAAANATPAPSAQTAPDACAAAEAVALNGRCTALIVGGSDHSAACNSRIILAPNAKGGLTVCFAAFADRARVAFAGTHEATIDAQSNAAGQSVDGVIFRVPNIADQLVAQGECKLGDPNQGSPTSIDCHADTKDGPFVGSFQTDGTPPVQP